MNDPKAVERAQMRVAVLRASYKEAVANVDDASAELREALLPAPDGQHHYRNALIAERVALEAYMEAILDLAALTRS